MSKTSWYFLGGVIILYGITAIIDGSKAVETLTKAKDILLRILPAFLLIFILLVLNNKYVTPKQLTKHLGKKTGWKAWAVTIGAGVISTGPIYLWYPLLHDLKEHGMREGLIATFLYARAVKIPMLPLLVAYFGLAYTVIISVTLIILAIIQGTIIERLEVDTT
ncbi:hypothetical protein GF367_03395 [Candidatus Woesearchaeota archaeon]|nr:hypothetical protein [Candidatus Woesearchaeota archaeon]